MISHDDLVEQRVRVGTRSGPDTVGNARAMLLAYAMTGSAVASIVIEKPVSAATQRAVADEQHEPATSRRRDALVGNVQG